MLGAVDETQWRGWGAVRSSLDVCWALLRPLLSRQLHDSRTMQCNARRDHQLTHTRTGYPGRLLRPRLSRSRQAHRPAAQHGTTVSPHPLCFTLNFNHPLTPTQLRPDHPGLPAARAQRAPPPRFPRQPHEPQHHPQPGPRRIERAILGRWCCCC